MAIFRCPWTSEVRSMIGTPRSLFTVYCSRCFSPFTVHRSRLSNPLLRQPAHHLGLVGVERLRSRGFETEHQHRLSIRGPDQPPPLRKSHPDAVDRVDGILGREVRHRPFGDLELELFLALDPDLGRGE